jgi:hypothetical protein
LGVKATSERTRVAAAGETMRMQRTARSGIRRGERAMIFISTGCTG